MKKLLLTLSITLLSIVVFSQNVGIGTNTPQAILDVVSTTNGFLPPRMTFAQRAAIVNPAQGLIVYCTDCIANGELSVFNGIEWKSANISNNQVVVTIPLAPTNLTAGLQFGPLYTSLNWEDVSTTESGYKIERKTENGFFINLCQLGANVTAYNDSSVAQNTVYSYRVYAYNTTGNSDQYSNIVSIATPGLSIINTTTVSSISPTSAISGGNITSDGGSVITARGVCWSTNANPTVDLSTKTVNGIGTGNFTSNFTGLTPNTTYHVRAYATNVLGTAYGADSVFTTLSIEPRMTIAAVRSMYTGSGLKVNTPASIAGIVTSDATQKNIATGTIIIQDQTAAIAVYFGGTMPYNVGDSIAFNITNDSLTNYRGSLQLKKPFGTSLPIVLSSNRPVTPVVKTIAELNNSLTNPLGSYSNMELTLVKIEGATASGVATYSGNKTLTDGTGSITMYTASSALFASTPMPSGPSNFTGYVKMYTTTKEFLIRNPNDVQPLTLAVMLPTVSEISINDISSDSAIILGNVESDGNDVLTAKGVCWSIYPDPTNDLTTKTDEGAVSGSFTSYITGLTPNTTYHVRAYATNSVGTAYSGDSVFTTLPILLPIVSTTAITSIAINNATSGGEVTFDGNLPITERGVVWSTSANPTIALSTKTVDGSGTGSFISSITGLTSNTTYHVRAYAKNILGISYGEILDFTTPNSLITIGSNYAGGIVFYIDNTGQHGLVASVVDVTSDIWGCGGTQIPGLSTSFGSGLSNTNLILAICNQNSIAARYCDTLNLNGFSDWYLPSRDELVSMYQQLKVNGIGDFQNDYYWSSSQYDSNLSYCVPFTSGADNNIGNKVWNVFYIRPIRSF